MRKPSSSTRLSVFDFNEDDDTIEKSSRKMLRKYKNPTNFGSDHNAVTKYDFLRCFAQGTKIQRADFNNEPLDVDAIDDAVKERISALDATAAFCSSINKPETNSCPDYLGSRSFFTGANSYAARALNLSVTSTGSKNLDSTLPHFLPDNEPIVINSDNDESVELSSSSTFTSNVAENEGPLQEQMLELGFGGCDIETMVVVSPDYIIYGDIFSSESRLTFSCSCIKLEGLTACGIKGPFSFEWTIGDLSNIDSQWCGRIETAIVNVRLKSNDTKIGENAKSSGIAELKFAVFDPHWSERLESIKSLDLRYKDIWNVFINIDTAKNEDGFLGQNSIFFSKHHFFNLDESFEDVVYPKGDPDAVSISKRDVQLLQPETFINDTIIDFYIKYLKNKLRPEEKHRFHFFNSFFFRKLADLEKDRACEGRAAFQRVRKWTRKVNLFEKDYIFIPVNFSLHWSLIVICHPGEVVNLKELEIEKLPKVPCILHMDSIKGSHRGLRNLFQSYLWEEWKERLNGPMEEVSSKFLNLRFVPLELPQQENSFDCGLFLLHYVELFVEQAPVNFSPFRISEFSSFLNKDWFLPAEASLKRMHIKKLIYEIVEDNSQKFLRSACDDKYSSGFSDINKGDTGVECLHRICNSTRTCGSCSNSNVDKQIDIKPLAANPPGGVQCFGEFELVFEGLLDPGDNAGLHTDGNYQPFEQMVSLNRFKNVMSPIEEGEETREGTSCSPLDEASGQHVAKMTEPSAASYSATGFRTPETQLFPGISMDREEYEKRDQSAGTSIGESPILSEVQANENRRPEKKWGLNPEYDKDVYELSSSTSSDVLAACVVEDSQEENETHDVNENYTPEKISESNPEDDDNVCELSSSTSSDVLAACVVEDSQEANERHVVSECDQEADSTEITDLTASHMPPVSELEDQQGTKRSRLTSPEVRRRPTRMLSKYPL